MSLPNIVLTGPPEMAEDHQIFGTAGPLGQCSKKLISNPDSVNRQPDPWGQTLIFWKCDVIIQSDPPPHYAYAPYAFIRDATVSYTIL